MTEENPFLVDGFFVQHDKYEKKKQYIKVLEKTLDDIAILVNLDKNKVYGYKFEVDNGKSLYPFNLHEAVEEQIKIIMGRIVPESANSAQLIEHYKHEALTAKASCLMQEQKLKHLENHIIEIEHQRGIEMLQDVKVKNELIECQTREKSLKQEIKDLKIENAELPHMKKEVKNLKKDVLEEHEKRKQEVENADKVMQATANTVEKLKLKIQKLENEKKELETIIQNFHGGHPVVDLSPPHHHHHQGHGRASGSSYTTIDPNPVVENNKKKMNKRWEAMKK